MSCSDNVYMSGINVRIKKIMKNKDITAKDLGLLTGIGYRTIESWTSTKKIMPRADSAVKIARALNTSVEYLVTGEEPGMPFLNEKEKKLIDASRRMTEDDMGRLLTIAESLATLSRGESSRTAG